jgi:hypothetical protein
LQPLTAANRQHIGRSSGPAIQPRSSPDGANAQELLVDGNPLENLPLIADPAKNFVVIMKDGVVYKNLLAK